MVQSMGLDEKSKGLDAPLMAEESREDAGDDAELDAAGATRIRSTAALANFVALDRLDIQVAVTVMCQDMSNPMLRSWARLKRVVRYLKKYPAMRFEYHESHTEKDLMIHVCSDSDWAGCKEPRRSRSGGIATIGGGVVKGWSNWQATVAMSSGEAEYYAIVKARAEALGIEPLHPGTASGKRGTWKSGSDGVQEAVARGRFTIQKNKGADFPADVLTKPLSQAIVQRVLGPCKVTFNSPLEQRLGAREGVGKICHYIDAVGPCRCCHFPKTKWPGLLSHPVPMAQGDERSRTRSKTAALQGSEI